MTEEQAAAVVHTGMRHFGVDRGVFTRQDGYRMLFRELKSAERVGTTAGPGARAVWVGRLSCGHEVQRELDEWPMAGAEAWRCRACERARDA